MESVSHFHCKSFLAGCQGCAPILLFPATWLFTSLRAPVRCSHLHLTQSRGHEGYSSLVLSVLCFRAGMWHRLAYNSCMEVGVRGLSPRPLSNKTPRTDALAAVSTAVQPLGSLCPVYPFLGVKETKRVLQLAVGVLGTGEGKAYLPGLQLGKHSFPGYRMKTAGEKGGAGIRC